LFLKVTRAYEVLKDEEKRKKYDMFGEEVDSSFSDYIIVERR
jgi:DnaJ-class molecular chaperone